MENSSHNQPDIFEVEFDHSAKEQLQNAASWAKLIAILSFVSYGVSLVAAFLGKETSLTGRAERSTGSLNLVTTLVTVLIGGAIAYFLYKFARKTNDGLQKLGQADLEEGFSALRYYFKIQGILMIILVVVVILGVIVLSIKGIAV